MTDSGPAPTTVRYAEYFERWLASEGGSCDHPGCDCQATHVALCCDACELPFLLPTFHEGSLTLVCAECGKEIWRIAVAREPEVPSHG